VTREASEAERLLDDAERWVVAQGYDLFARQRAITTLEYLA
jgi:hypothetical protein